MNPSTTRCLFSQQRWTTSESSNQLSLLSDGLQFKHNGGVCLFSFFRAWRSHSLPLCSKKVCPLPWEVEKRAQNYCGVSARAEKFPGHLQHQKGRKGRRACQHTKSTRHWQAHFGPFNLPNRNKGSPGSYAFTDKQVSTNHGVWMLECLHSTGRGFGRQLLFRLHSL